uniref:Pectinesterase inhibitor domain-containing protein n=1 Tax=Leersia perrieri TaxID=77586 RepID=A0A0D9UVX7_9ORYZ
MATPTPMLLLAVAAVVMSTAATLLPTATGDAVFLSSICNKTHNDKCAAVLNSSPDTADAATVGDLATIALDLAVAAAGVINDKASSYDPSSPEYNALRVCGGAYFDAVNDLDIDARDGLNSGDYATAVNLVSGAGAAADDCENAVANGKVASVMADVDQKMKDRCGVARDVINLLIPPKSN